MYTSHRPLYIQQPAHTRVICLPHTYLSSLSDTLSLLFAARSWCSTSTRCVCVSRLEHSMALLVECHSMTLLVEYPTAAVVAVQAEKQEHTYDDGGSSTCIHNICLMNDMLRLNRVRPSSSSTKINPKNKRTERRRPIGEAAVWLHGNLEDRLAMNR